MPRPTTEQMFEWANNPSEWQYLGFATSQEELEELREFSITERRKFLLDAALRGLNAAEPEGSAEYTEPKEVCFSDIPLKTVLSLEDCVAMSIVCAELASGETDFNKRWIWSESDTRRIWKDYATHFSLERGFAYTHSKYTDQKSEKKTERHEFWARPEIPFFMHGITRIAEASLDLDAVQVLIDEYEAGDRAILSAPHPMRFWRGLVEQKRLYDGFYRSSYADVVETMDEGVYVAQYLDDAVAQAGQYICIDDYYIAAIRLGSTLQQASTGFTRIVRELAPNYKGFNQYYGAQRVLPNGAVFFEKRLLPLARCAVGEQGRNKAIIAVIDVLMGVNDSPKRFTDEEYRQIVFGE